ncbi:hypothetical protein [Haloferax gibbonsii]|uniref:hypothetical protein n=1 Tax=Haloferax gibbonsii TaxID=35746 RepID=UPI001874BF8D|nr:hypothetical protein [Haloferax gibbonsii]
MKITPKTVITGAIALFIALKVGPEISQAKREAAIPLLGQCTSLIGVLGNGLTSETVGSFVVCWAALIAVILIVSISGTVGIFREVFNNLR